MQKKLSCWAEQDRCHRFFDLFDLVRNVDWLWQAHLKVSSNAGSKTAGCDGINMQEFNKDLESNLQGIRDSLSAGTFVANPVRRVYIPKSGGKLRPLGIPSIRDRIVQEACRMVLEPIYESDFCQTSYGFRPTRCTMDAIKRILWYTHDAKKMHWIIEGDISCYFDTINHRKLMKLLRRRVKDEKFLELIWKFLRSGVMEGKLFKDTQTGTPQGGIISPLLANVYLHELDKYMEKYTALSFPEKTRRRKQGLSNYAYCRYADDWVILCNGAKEQAFAMREEVQTFLAEQLHLTLSLEKTKVTHLNDGFNFLGFNIRRSMGREKMTTKVLIAADRLKRHRDKLRAATAPSTHEDSFITKVNALNRIIAGWCRYFQYTSRASTAFARISHLTYWLFAHWLGRKYRLSMPSVHKRFLVNGKFGNGTGLFLHLHAEFHSRRYFGRFIKPNPYLEDKDIEREELLDDDPWGGTEDRSGSADVRRIVIQRDGYRCQMCHAPVTLETAQVDHRRSRHRYKKPEDTDSPEFLWTLCIPCHRTKTEHDRQMESRMR